MPQMDEIYRKYAATVYKYLLSRTQNRDLAEELTQETFYQAIRTIDRYDESCTVSTWLCAIARNQLLAYRRKHPEEAEVTEYTRTAPDTEETVLASMDRVALMKTLHHLEEPWRELLWLRIYGTLSFKEIGEIFGKTENWARVNYYRGKEKLKKEIEHDEDTL
ncbi:MAG: sigma-70 family RNA polymerase sigma factor [Solobacterium sp.]|nr:sigma-70 family RNA polymerase sigma factor [Solobacterium sp.]